MKVSLGPIQYHWSRQQIVEFYQAASSSDADIIYLGETVCSKRTELHPNEWIELTEELSNNTDKQIVLSTQTLLETPADMALLKRYCDNSPVLIEANDMGAIGLLSDNKLPFVSGHAINCYNARTLKQLRNLGMQRWVMPVELSRQWLSKLLQEANDIGVDMDFETEVFSHGYLPLAYSARCFTSRNENREKSDCQQCCIQYPQGLAVKSQAQQRIFTLNGIQTQSGYCYNLLNDLASMDNLVDVARISPLDIGSLATVSAFKHRQPDQQPLLASQQQCNGYWQQNIGMANIM
ncbi:hypothetical protein SIN8267_02913 [Sinobacterium norvegicum]|uniref:Ubiquinone biosynthesis protein UbiV n=1 Tax=Sinobacterium norvegicum TaxID=1641715 RepID=A0ABM9AHV6_9GAMM|nr:U32 family peptidase [Sinobacterium norvegicum]CAH0992776.1 hypothetical protein SIN8267_02913 [Sinobacterium norvegicum]